MKKRFKIPIIITVITLVISCFTIPAFATPSSINPDETLYEPIFYPKYTDFHLFDVNDMTTAFHALYDTSFYGSNDTLQTANQFLMVDINNTNKECTYSVTSSMDYVEPLGIYAYSTRSYPFVQNDEFAPLNITYYFDDIGVRGDLYDNINHQSQYPFIVSFEDQDRNNLLESYTVYFKYKSYDYAADDFRIQNYQGRFEPISNDLTQFISSAYGVDSNMLYVNPLEIVKQEAENNGLSLFGVITDIRIEVDLESSVIPQIMSFSFADEKGFNEEYTTSVRDDLYMKYGEDNSPSAEAPSDIFGWIVDCADALFQFEIMPGLTISVIFVGILGILVFIYIMKRFAGG